LAIKPALSVASVLKKASQHKPTKPETQGQTRRLLKEMQKTLTDPHPAILVFPSEENIRFWRILLIGPDDTPYSGGVFLLYAEFPAEYPAKPPVVRFQTPIYHCNISRNGRVCHSVFSRNYESTMDFKFLMSCVYGLLMTPEPADPLSSTMAEEFHTNKAQYEVNAKQCTTKYASKSLDERKAELLGNKSEILDDVPEHLTCSITLELFKDPVITIWNGKTYERVAIEQHIQKFGTDPVDTSKKLTLSDLVPNLAIVNAIEAHLTQQKEINKWWET